MNIIDILLILPLLLGIFYGIFKGLRPSLWLLVVLLTTVLGSLLLMGPLERIILDLSGLGASNYPDAPGVAVLILYEETLWANVAALIPTGIGIILILLHIVVGRVYARFIPAPSTNSFSRISGALIGILSGLIFSLLVIIQIHRLPWTFLGTISGDSIIVTGLQNFVPSLLPLLFSGI